MDFFSIVAAVRQRYEYALYPFIICLDYVIRELIKENSFTKMARSWRYPIGTITDTDYADDIALLANTPTQALSFLESLEQTAVNIGLHVNVKKTCVLIGDVSSTLQMLVICKFTYRSVPSIESDVNTHLSKAWTAIDRLLII